ncbi:MAG: hypothetical protein JSV44_05690 [Candidatus Zixiibacteriota bacterium]|nr:MAG: hypothetical protein JSV44_05690 [candidate division Zixibacteria bacterium]
MTGKRQLKRATVLLLGFLFCWVSVAQAAVPAKINYQGYLTDAAGNPVDGMVDMTFKIYNVDSGGTALWTETQLDVEVTNGIYHAQIGAVVALPYNIFDGDLYLGVAIETDPEMTPRQQLTSSAFAIKAQDTITFGGLPTGSFIQQNEANSISSAMIQNGTISAADIGANAVGASEIATNAVGAAEIGAGAVGSSEVADNSLTASDLGVNSVGSSEIMTGAVTAVDMQDGAALTEISDDDGPGSGLNADLLDNLHSSAFMAAGTDIWVNVTGDTMSGSTTGNMLKVDNTSSSGGGTAIYARTYSETGYAVAGFSMNSGAFQNEGGRFMAYGDNGRGVYGRAADTGSGTNYGGYFEGLSSYGRGAYGEARGAYGRGIEGTATNSGAYTNYGGYFTASGTSGRGVYASASGSNGYGVYAYSANGDGIYGTTGASDEHAGYFNTNVGAGLTGAALYARSYNSSSAGIALWAQNAHTTSTDATAVFSNSGSGPLLKGFGGNGGEDEFRFDNDGTLRFYDSTHSQMVVVDPVEDTNGPAIYMYNSDGVRTIELDAGYAGPDGRIITDELQITGGSDLSEQFDVNPIRTEVKPGLVVSIDPQTPGELQVSTDAYDKKVAGIISGANGVKPGMLMGQRGTEADGSYPVALSGRVYCWADASNGPIEPGDLLTTSTVPGHAMRVSDYPKAQGAILGKAMSQLDSGKGMVLVLVSLQ